ncbi:hypothetical protein BGZ74_000758 [Mortierella antarctica]|nr:hypothetical protein BGZ74_000758 [Mortierella antarctica]KAG0354828.1 hypothetical protein BG005_006180 [Podila minutissima]
MKLSAFTTFLALSAILLTAYTTLAQTGCRSTTLRFRYPMKANMPPGSIRVDWIVNGGYSDTMYLDAFPRDKVCSDDGFWCVWADFFSTYGFPRMGLVYRKKTRFYPEVHVWLAKDEDWEEVEYWDCI